MDGQQEIDDAVRDVLAQIQALEDFVDELLRENKPENAEIIACILEDIKKRNTVH